MNLIIDILVPINKRCARKIHISLFYFPPNTPSEVYMQVCDIITAYVGGLPNSVEVLLLGDFNIPEFKTDNIYLDITTETCSKAETLCNFIGINDRSSYNTV